MDVAAKATPNSNIPRQFFLLCKYEVQSVLILLANQLPLAIIYQQCTPENSWFAYSLLYCPSSRYCCGLSPIWGPYEEPLNIRLLSIVWRRLYQHLSLDQTVCSCLQQSPETAQTHNSYCLFSTLCILADRQVLGHADFPEKVWKLSL